MRLDLKLPSCHYTPLLKISFPKPVLGSSFPWDLVLECDPEVIWVITHSFLNYILFTPDPNVLPKVGWFGWFG